jgi:predicted DNA-binding protein with PD1-like motif
MNSPEPAHPPPPAATLESGTLGRVAYARVAPNEDLVQRVEDFCAAQGFRHAFVRGALGSLVDACLLTADGTQRHITGPALEVVGLNGEVRTSADGVARAALCAVVADMQGNLSGGPLVRGGNRVCMTFEVTLEEWLPTATQAV